MTCPYCGEDGLDAAFRHPSDQRYLKKRIDWERRKFCDKVMDDALAPIREAMKRMASGSRGMITVTSTTTRRPLPPRPLAPRRSDLLRNVACGLCRREYGVYALALFCPDCGGPNLSTHFAREAGLVRDEIALASDPSEAERIARRIANAHEDVVSALEAYLKAVYVMVARRRESPATPPRVAKIGNAFQNIEKGRKLYEPFGVDPFGCLDDEGLAFLTRMLLKRHAVAHNLGIADEKYVAQSGDGSSGKPVALTHGDVERLVALVANVVQHLERTVPEFLPSAPRRDGDN
jgi:rRNA maturation protein Nop10